MTKITFETEIKIDELKSIIDERFANENNRKINQRGFFSRKSNDSLVLNYYNYKGLGNILYSRARLINSFIGTYKKINNKTIVYGEIYNFKNDIFSVTLFCILSFIILSIILKIANSLFVPTFLYNIKIIGIIIDYIFSCVIPITITSIIAYYKYYINPYKYNKFLIFFIVNMLKCRVININ